MQQFWQPFPNKTFDPQTTRILSIPDNNWDAIIPVIVADWPRLTAEGYLADLVDGNEQRLYAEGQSQEINALLGLEPQSYNYYMKPDFEPVAVTVVDPQTPGAVKLSCWDREIGQYNPDLELWIAHPVAIHQPLGRLEMKTLLQA